MSTADAIRDQFVYFDVGPMTIAVPAATVDRVQGVESPEDLDAAVDLASEFQAGETLGRRSIVRLRVNEAVLGLAVGRVRRPHGQAAAARFAIPSEAGEEVASAFSGVLCDSGRLIPVLNVANWLGSTHREIDAFRRADWRDVRPTAVRPGRVVAFRLPPVADASKPVWFGLPMSSVVELALTPEVQSIPFATPPVRGWIEWRGRPLIVKDMAGGPDLDLGPTRLAIVRQAGVDAPYGLIVPAAMKIIETGRANRPCSAAPITTTASVQGWFEFRTEFVGLLSRA